jgi:hypothetical protein
MRFSPALFISVVVAIVFSTQELRAQQVVMSSSLTRDTVTGEMVGFSRTEMDFLTQGWYQADVENEIRRQSDNALLVSGSAMSMPGVNGVASKTIRTPGTLGTTYRLDSNHYVLPISYFACTGTRNDYYGYSWAVWQTNTNYGATKTLSGFPPGLTGGNCVIGWIYLGKTTQSAQVPSVSITNSRVGGDLAGTTKSALLGTDIVLGSTTSPAGGVYHWVFTGPYSVSGGSIGSSSVTIRSTDVGTITAKLEYTANGIPASPQVTINVVIPALGSFTAEQNAAQIALPFMCRSDPFSWYQLGCGVPGIKFSASVSAPSFISDPSQSGIKYVQAVSGYRKQMKGGNLKCETKRTDPSNVDSGWQLDTEDPYVFTEYPVHRFSEGNNLTMPTVDNPALPVTFITPWEWVDALQIDDRFEMYVVYFTFDETNPPTKRTLGKLVWNWGGLVVFDEPGSHQIKSSTFTPGPRAGQVTNSMVSMQGNVKDATFVQCPGAPPTTTNHIDASRYFVKQHYLDFLGRDPSAANATPEDAAGWNYWTSLISKCGFDFNCIDAERVHIGLAFFYAGDFIANDPDMAHPPGTPGFNPAVYNRAFVKHCYLNYLQRDPSLADQGGWDFWTNDLNSNGDYGHTIKAFIVSTDYRIRFGQP